MSALCQWCRQDMRVLREKNHQNVCAMRPPEDAPLAMSFEPRPCVHCGGDLRVQDNHRVHEYVCASNPARMTTPDRGRG